MKRIPKTDTEFEDCIIKKVQDYPDDDFFQIECDGGMYIGCPKFKDGFMPKSGMTLRIYSKGFGYPARGMVIDNHIAYYRTPTQQEAHHKKMVAKMNKESKERFAKSKKSLEIDYKSLPPVLQSRLDRLRKNSPRDRHNWEPYEMYILKEASKVADTLKTPESVKDILEKRLENAFEKVPSLDTGHTGNTIACAFSLAYKILAGIEV